MTGQLPGKARAETAKQLRKLRARRLLQRMLIFVALPTVLATIYYGAIVSSQYESSSAFTIQSADGGAGASLELLIAAVPSSGTGRDVMLVQQYALSRDMLQLLIDDQGFVDHYSDASVDVVSRLSDDASSEETYEYFRDKIIVEHDSQSGVLTLRVKAFTSEKAHELASAILEASEQMVNELTEQARSDRTALARRETVRAEARLTKARQEMLRVQRESAELNPAESAAALLGVRTRLEGELASARAELSALSATLQAGAPRLIEQRQRVSALRRQLDLHTRRLASNDGEGLHEAIALFEPVVAEKEFAQRAYESALTSLEMARIEADRQHRYLVTIASPSRPSHPTHPRFWHGVLTVLVLAFALLGIGTLLIASIREHANV